eukprot:m.13099 g.13099  ORF g.13099 m.13099 type:complete len:371 (+) comp8016_c0_seq1:139-1251(+)
MSGELSLEKLLGARFVPTHLPAPFCISTRSLSNDPPSHTHLYHVRPSSLANRNMGAGQNFSCDLGPSRRLVLLRAAISSAYWPSVGVVAGSEPTTSKDGSRGRRLLVHSKDNMGLRAHPGSIVSGLQMGEVGQLRIAMFQTKMITSSLFLDGITLVSPLTAVLFGGAPHAYSPPVWNPESDSGLVQDKWLATKTEQRLARCVLILRAGINIFVANQIGDGDKHDHGASGGDTGAREFVNAIAELLEADQGLSGDRRPTPRESMVRAGAPYERTATRRERSPSPSRYDRDDRTGRRDDRSYSRDVRSRRSPSPEDSGSNRPYDGRFGRAVHRSRSPADDRGYGASSKHGRSVSPLDRGSSRHEQKRRRRDR